MPRRTPGSSARAWLLAVVLAASALAFGGCGGEAEPAVDDATTPTSPPPPATAPPPAPAPAPAKATPRQIVIVVDQGRPRGGIKRPKLERGAKLVLVVRADLGEAVHIHGYDVERRLTPGKPLRIPLTVSIAGRFEVELHHPDSLLAVLEVRP